MARKRYSDLAKYTVLRDQQEKANYWQFDESPWCHGTETVHLKTGDYTLSGMENFFTIERKFSTGEFSTNITEKRFERELIRMDKMDQSYLILEFGWKEIEEFPVNSTIPSKYWKDLRVTSKFLRKRLIEIMSDYNVQVILAENRGPEIAEQIFKRMNILYGQN